MNIAIVFAGGSGVRMGAGVPKQFFGNKWETDYCSYTSTFSVP